ncbi:pyruvate kinase [Candidatus Uhrbacteria bacterium]|nr:pyruvate kinase [Candidatus Uhrbacteria bacterium]
MVKQTKIVATIGPASESPAILSKLIESGMNVARLNFSHGTHANHAQLIRSIRVAARNAGKTIGILADLQGPRIRLGELPSSGIEVLANSHVTFTTRAKPPLGTVPVTYANLHKDLKRGDRLLIADGTIEVIVERVQGHEIVTRVMVGGLLKSHKGVNVPTATLHIPPLTAKDKDDLKFALSKGVDMVALSFVISAENVTQLRKEIQAIARRIKKPEIASTSIVVKMEKHEAVEVFDEILVVADGVMVARGDLALEVDQAQIPELQRAMIESCRAAGKPVIVATQMLESMTDNPRPTRAEISDVGHAVMDHTDATMLSGETAGGKYPVESVATMANIILETERSKWDDVAMADEKSIPHSQRAWMGSVARLLTDESAPRCIVVASATGSTARWVSSFRPPVPIVAAVPTAAVANRLALVWGVAPVVVGVQKKLEASVAKALKEIIKQKIAASGDSVVVVGSDTMRKDAVANVLELRRV